MRASGRIWLFRILSALLIPVVVLVSVELGLKLAGVGVSTSLSHETTLAGERRHLSNPDFTRSFFPPQLRREVLPFNLPVAKDAGTFRIFLLGASAANGVPEPAYGMGRILETMLDAVSTGLDFEVVNVAITAVNSHVVRRVADQCRQLDPDLFVVYLGNNEVVGPYGAGTVFSPLATSPRMIRADIALKSTRLGQLVNRVAARLSKDDELPMAWRGMEMFLANQVALDDPRMEVVYAHYERNLRDICSIGKKAGIPVVLASVGVNLKDCAPFASQPGQEGSAQEWFERGRAQYAAGELEAAHASLARARDLDTLRFRADSRIDAVIREVARSEGVHFADAKAALEAASEGGIPGREVFFEHVHLNFHGNYVVARALFEQIGRAVPSVQGEPLPESECARRLAFTLYDQFNLVRQVREMISHPPFPGQSNHAEQVAHLEAWIAELDTPRTPEAMEDMVAQYRALAPRAHWLQRHHQASFTADVLGDLAQAERTWRGILAELPQFAMAYSYVAGVLARQQQYHEAKQLWEQSLAKNPYQADVHNNLANCILALQPDDEAALEQAIEHYRIAYEMAPSPNAQQNLQWALERRAARQGSQPR